jgi:hypothetical protein
MQDICVERLTMCFNDFLQNLEFVDVIVIKHKNTLRLWVWVYLWEL